MLTEKFFVKNIVMSDLSSDFFWIAVFLGNDILQNILKFRLCLMYFPKSSGCLHRWNNLWFQQDYIGIT